MLAPVVVLLQERGNQMNKQEAYEQLHQAGFAGAEISGLLYLCEKYIDEQAKREECLILRRLEFVRWLVRTGRLTEQVGREKEPVQEHEGSPQPA
jgi:hypothetical protein